MQKSPTIFIPGLKGTGLADLYSIEAHTTWSFWEALLQPIRGVSFSSLALDESGTTDYSMDVQNYPTQVLEAAYGGYVSSLRERLTSPVYLHRYDWRKGITQAADKLNDLVADVCVRMDTSGPWSGRINFVGHSMGGLVIRKYLQKYSRNTGAAAQLDATPSTTGAAVGRVVFIATPHLGALDAVDALVRGESSWFGGKKELRKLARTFPSVYELLPTFENAILDTNGNSVDIFDFDNWQTNVTESDASYRVTKARLVEAKKTLEGLPYPQDCGVLDSDILTLYGDVPSAVPAVLRIVHDKATKWFDFGTGSKTTGDGTVPSVSAMASRGILVPIIDADVSYRELFAKISLHAGLPDLDEVQTISGRFLEGVNDMKDLLPVGMYRRRFA